MPSAGTWVTLTGFGMEKGESQNPTNRFHYRRPRHQHTSVNLEIDALRRQGQRDLGRCADVSSHEDGGWLLLYVVLHAIGSFKDVAHLSAYGYLKTLLTFLARLEIRGCSDLCAYECVLFFTFSV